MKPLSVEMACLLGIQNEIQAVWGQLFTPSLWKHSFTWHDYHLSQSCFGIFSFLTYFLLLFSFLFTFIFETLFFPFTFLFHFSHCLDLDLNDQKTRRYFWQWFYIWKWKSKEKREKNPTRRFGGLPIQPIRRFLKNCQSGTF